MSNLKIYARLSETPNVVQQLWPKQSFEEYAKTSHPPNQNFSILHYGFVDVT